MATWTHDTGSGLRGVLEAPAAEGSIDIPAGHLSADETSTIEGWVLFPSESVARVEISVDGRWIGRARPAVARPDLAAHSPRAEAGLCGFEFWLEPQQLPSGAQQVTVGACALGMRGSVAWLTKEAVNVRGGATGSQTDKVDLDADLSDDLAVLRKRVEEVIAASSSPPTHPLRLLAFSHQLSYGGAQLFMFEMIRLLRAEDGSECTVVGLSDGPLREVLESMGVQVHIVDQERSQNPVVYEGRLSELAAWAAPQGFNAVLANTIDTFVGVDLAGRLGVPAVWFVHESFDLAVWWGLGYGAKGSYVWRRMLGAMKEAAAVIFEAERTRQQYLPYASAERLIAAPYGLMADEIDRYRAGLDRRQLRRSLDIAEDATVVLCLGTIEPRKGQAALALAFAELAETFPHAVLALVGATDLGWLEPLNEELRRFVVRAGLESRMVIVPVTPDPYQWLGVADVFVLASDIESLPRVVLEAMAFELPVVATSIFGVTDLIEDERTGYLCPERDVGALREALERVLTSDPEDRRAVARAGAEHVRGHHDARRYSRRIGDLLQNLVADRHALPSQAMTPS